MKFLMVILIFLSAPWSGAVFGETQSVNFTATVSSVFNQNGNGLALASNLGIAVGNTITGRYFFDPNHPDGSLDPNIGLYNNISSPFVINLQTASRLYSFQSNSNRITVWNQATFDEIDVISLSSVISNLPAGASLGQMNVFWNDQSATALSSEALVAPPPFPWNFKRVRLLAFDDGNGNQFGLFAEIDSFVPSQAYVVMNTNDSGAGSLREAIDASNTDPNPNVITFDPAVFPAASPCAAPYVPFPPLPHLYFGPYGPNVAVPALGTVVLTSQLPVMIGSGDSIDGTGACVVIDGRNVSTQAGLRVRAKDVTIQGLTFQNFIGNDAVRVDARDSIFEVTGVLVRSNQFYRNRRAVRVTGGEGMTAVKKVHAAVSLNTIQDVESGIRVEGNDRDDIGPGNQVDALVINNLVQGTFTPVAGVRGDGINVSGATNVGSNNEVNVIVGFNTVRDLIDDGITAGGCGGGDTGLNNFVQANITFNTVAHFVNGRAPDGIVNNGIIVFGSGGESAAISNCTDNTVRFLVSNNTVTGFPNSNISISGGDEGTSDNDVSGDVLANTVMNSIGNPSTPNVGGNGIQVTGGSGTANTVHSMNICGNGSQRNFNRGISISGGSGTGSLVENINICDGNTVRDNASDGIGILGGSGTSNTVNNISVLANNLSGNDDGIFVTGGDSSNNTVVSNVSINGNQSNRNLRDGVRVSRGDATNIVLLSGITNNTFSRNGRDGIGISSNASGGGNTPVSGNRCDDNGDDGIEINSDAYSLSNNTCNGNKAGDGINAVGTGIGANLNDGGNRARRNAACNEPNFCF